MAAAMLALAQAAPPTGDEILVIARRMREISVDVRARRRDGRLVLRRCRVTKPAGYAEIDAVPCQAAAACVEDSNLDFAALQACVVERSQPMIDAILLRWRGQQP